MRTSAISKYAMQNNKEIYNSPWERSASALHLTVTGHVRAKCDNSLFAKIVCT